MKIAETAGTIAPDGTLTMLVPPEVAPGAHRVVVVIDEQVEQVAEQGLKPQPVQSLDFPVRDYGPWPEGLLLQREDMYGDDGR